MDVVSMQLDKEMLQAEIEFWRHMIVSRRGMVSEQVMKRMHDACALAERKLVLMRSSEPSNETMQ
ncbi:MAG: hypothetical protein PVJ71_01215 [Lysobacterales bacterium]|jgi:hypothetical protein